MSGGAGKRKGAPPERSVDIPSTQLLRIPNTEATVAHARDIEELKKLLCEADQTECFVAVKRSVPKSSLSLPQGSVIIVPDFLKSRKIVVTKGKEPRAPSIRVPRTALVRDLISAQLPKDDEEPVMRDAFLPLAVDPDKAVLSELFRNNDPRATRNYFQRSARPLRDHVLSFTYLPLSSPVGSDATSIPSEFVMSKWSSADGTAISFEDKLVVDATLQVDPDEAKMQARRLVLLYDKAVFEEDIVDAFNENYPKALQEGTLEGVDLTVEIFNKPLYVTTEMMILVTACSTTRRHDAAIEALFPKLLKFAESELLVDPTDIHGMTTGVPEGTKAFNLKADEYGGSLSAEEFTNFSEWLKIAVHAAAFEANRNLLAHFRLLRGNNNIYADVSVFQTDDAARMGWVQKEIEDIPEFPDLSRSNLSKLEEPDVSISTSKDRKVVAPLAPIAREMPISHVEGLGGIEILRPDHHEYDLYRAQYASFEESYPDDQFRPHFIAHPQDTDQVKTIINYAVKKSKKVVVRSGGHQYCGLSSGDDSYIQVLMDKMKDVDEMKDGIDLSFERAQDVRDRGCSVVSPDGRARQWFVTVASRCRLKDISQRLVAENLTIPHGECPLVGIGGHVQTGGYGHQMRGLGLCLDYVYSFDIVVYPGYGGAAKLVTVYRPELTGDAPGKDPDLNDDLYKGVLGGSPGAFGVITRIKFLAVHDGDPAYGKSHNVQAVCPYRGRNIQKGATQIVRTMLKYTLQNTQLEEGLDLFVTILSFKIGWFELGMVLPELAYTGPTYPDPVKNQIDEILDACKSEAIFGIGNLLKPFVGQRLAPRPPSVVAHKGVRSNNNGVTKLGREFDHPYKKRVNVALGPLSAVKAEEFARQFGRLTADVVLDKDLLLVIQMNLGGGKVVSNDEQQQTGIPHRKQTFGFVFDVFYKRPEAEHRAAAIQDRMQELLDATGGFDNRLFWGSFGREKDETKMSDEKVQKLYYGTREAYRSMQDIKDKVDPSGIFTTEFTVQNHLQHDH